MDSIMIFEIDRIYRIIWNISEFLQIVGNMVFFVAIHVGKPHGIVECWNSGYKKRKKIYSTKNVAN